MKQGIFLRNAWALALALVLASFVAGGAFATPNPNGAYLDLRVFDDCPLSVLTTNNNYPAEILISDQKGAVACGGWANLHIWKFSEDGGATPAVFNNGDSFHYSFDMVLNGDGEAGAIILPWWSTSDGRFNIRSTDGEIACFGGRLPFYSFTGSHGLHYTRGTPIHLSLVYSPNDLSSTNPATIAYELTYNGQTYNSGPLKFDMGNPAEDPPYGLWGMLNSSRGVGGYLQPLFQLGSQLGADATFTNIQYQVVTPVQVILDVKPGTCENSIAFQSKGSLGAAILGSSSVDVSTIFASSLRLNGVSAKSSEITDLDNVGSACGDCDPQPVDAYSDLALKFSTAQVVGALSPLTSEEVTLEVSGLFSNGFPFEGTDCATIKGNWDGGNQHLVAGFRTLSAPSAPVQIVQYSVPAPTQVRLAVYSVTGRLVKELVQGVQAEGVHSISWDASQAPSGMYFYKFQAGEHQETVKSVIVH